MAARAYLWCLPLVLPLAALAAQDPPADREILLPRNPQVSPDGRQVAFAWRGDLWVAPIAGGKAERVTSHPADDDQPCWHPDGRQLAFVSDRDGGNHIFVMTLPDGAPRQVTVDSLRKDLLGFAEGGRSLLVTIASDEHFHGSESRRLYLLDVAGEKPRRLLLDAGVGEAALSPDGSKVLFTRGRSSWWRKGYLGAAAEQLWLADLTATPPAIRRLGADREGFQNVTESDPMWAPDGKGCYFVSDPDGTFDLYYRGLDGGADRRVTRVGKADGTDDGLAFPSLSADGRTLVARRRFQLVRVDVGSGAVQTVRLEAAGDRLASMQERRTERSADTVAFTKDGKQMAFVAGEDIYVMDRVLKEPVRVTSTPNREGNLVFSADGRTLWFTSDAGGEMDIWQATCPREDGWWWLAQEFPLRQVTDDRAVEDDLALSPTGDLLAYARDNDLWVMQTDGTEARVVVTTWSGPDFDWSPDGRWFVYATQDDDYNHDVWITPLDGSRPPFNISRHPGRDGSPRWSPDGTRIAFVANRDGEESDIWYVNLQRSVEEKTGRDRKLEEAIEAMKKKPGGRSGAGGATAGGTAAAGDGAAGRGRRRGGAEPTPADPAAAEPAADQPQDPVAKPEVKPESKPPTPVTIDWDQLLDRRHRISVPGSSESGLLWSPDGKKLAFNATVDNERGFFTVEFPEVGRPKRLGRSGLSRARWLEEGNEIVGLASGAEPAGDETPPGVPPFRGRGGFGMGGGGGVPAAMNSRGDIERFEFTTRQVRDWQALRQLAFDQGWRAMRDRFYDVAMNNRDWDAVRAKYRPAAAQCLGRAEFSDLMNLMLGELNASHMGHSGGSDPLPQAGNAQAWSPTTHHLGLRLQRGAGPGLQVRSVIPGSPCAQARSRVEPGETLLAVDGRALDGSVELEQLLTMDQTRDVELTVRGADGTERKVTVRPVTSVAGLLYDEWVEDNRKQVERLSGGKLGYLHIRGMDMRSVRQMEEDLYAAGHGKDGLIIDVRFNGGGSTTDHVLTMLTQPVHAVTRSRGSGDGYPVDRKVYATWSRPIVLMCNEYSFSNAEILSHAVKQIGRGRLVGMRTGGGVISTGSQRLVDGSSVRMPTRGWYLTSTGEDMELNGCLPDVALWNPPGGADLQLQRAVQVLAEDVAAEQARPRPEPVPAALKRLQEQKAQPASGGNGGDR